MKTRINFTLAPTTIHVISIIQKEHGITSMSKAIDYLANEYRLNSREDAIAERVAEIVVEKMRRGEL